jgi:hypothetical protein
METRTHPTHHDGYHPSRAMWGAGIGLAGVFLCVFVTMVDAGESRILHVLKASVLWAGALAFIGGTGLALLTEIPHRFARCVSCGRLLRRTRIDYQRSYYPCRRCKVRWTCPCRKAAD